MATLPFLSSLAARGGASTQVPTAVSLRPDPWRGFESGFDAPALTDAVPDAAPVTRTVAPTAVASDDSLAGAVTVLGANSRTEHASRGGDDDDQPTLLSSKIATSATVALPLQPARIGSVAELTVLDEQARQTPQALQARLIEEPAAPLARRAEMTVSSDRHSIAQRPTSEPLIRPSPRLREPQAWNTLQKPEAEDAAPPIEISIGRIELRSAPPPAVALPRPTARPSEVDFSAYARLRAGLDRGRY